MNVIFFPVKNTAAKLLKLSQIAQKHLDQKEPLLFLVPDQNAYDFLDKLLWSTPAESFLPHPTEWIQIGMELQGCSAVFNLMQKPLLEGGVKTVYEFEDHTTPEKHQVSQERYHTYRDQQYSIVVES